MQAVAKESGVSVGLIHRCFSGKDDLLLAVVVNVLEALADQVPAAVLTYRESKTLNPEGRE